MDNVISKRKIIKALVVTLELLAIGGFLYLIFLPFYPDVKYYFELKNFSKADYKNIDDVKKVVEQIKEAPLGRVDTGKAETEKENSQLPGKVKDNTGDAKNTDGGQVSAAPQDSNITNRLIIPKIGVNAPIIESPDENYGLARGVWHLPNSSTPEEQGNMIITGHRFKYLPPNNLTFYLFHKLEKGDIASVIWGNKIYYYQIKEIKIVGADDVSILQKTNGPILTMYTCDPVYSTKNRLVVIGELMEDKK